MCSNGSHGGSHGDVSFGTLNDKEIINKLEESSKLIKFYADMYITVIDGKIDINDYDTMNTVIENLNSYFLNMYGKYGNLDKEVSDMVKSFYNPKIAEEAKKEGKIEGKQEGKQEEKKSVAKNMLLDGENVEKIKKYTGLSDEDISNIRKLIEGEGKH